MPERNSRPPIEAVIALVALLVGTNPSEESHREEINDKINELRTESLEIFFGTILLDGLSLIYDPFEYHNCLVFSYTTFGDKVVTLGALTVVF